MPPNLAFAARLADASIIELWLSASDSSRQFGSSLAMVEMPVWFDT